MNVMDAVLACYGSHKGHTPSERTGKCGNFVETWVDASQIPFLAK